MGKVIIEILESEGCAKCVGLRERVKGVVHQLKDKNIEVKHLDLFDDQERIIELRIYTSPALIINGKLYFMGTIPSEEEIKNIILENLGE